MMAPPGLLITLTSEQNAPRQHLLLGPSPDCEHAGHWRIDCSTLHRQSLPHVPPPQEKLSPYGTGSQRLILSWCLCPKAMETTGAWDACLGNGLVSAILTDTQAILIILHVIIYPSQMSDCIDD